MAALIPTILYSIVFYSILIILSIILRNTYGKIFLVLFLAFSVFSRLGGELANFAYWGSNFLSENNYWNLVFLFSLAFYLSNISLGMFIFSLWNRNRTKMAATGVLFSFKNRIPRSTFWIVYVILYLNNVMIGTVYVTQVSMVGIGWSVIFFVGWLLLNIWFTLALLTKRWHDLNRSGWMSLLMLIPIIGPFIVLGWCGFTPGNLGPNAYGDPSSHVNSPTISNSEWE